MIIKRNTKKSNRIDEEKLCMNFLLDYLKHKIGCGEVQAKRESNDPPDFWLTVDGRKFAVEVTSIAKNASYFPSCKRLAKYIEMQAKQKGWLSGKYTLQILGNPKIQKVNSKDWKEVAENALGYIHQTMNLSRADINILYKDSKGVLKIEKLAKNESYVAVLASNAKFEGPMIEELGKLLQKAISMKISNLSGFRSSCSEIILLLYDAYIYADIIDVRQAFRDVAVTDFFHSIFWVQGLKRNARSLLENDVYAKGYILFTKDKKWIENH